MLVLENQEYSVGLPDGNTLAHVTVIRLNIVGADIISYTAVHHTLDADGNHDDRTLRIPGGAEFLPYVEDTVTK